MILDSDAKEAICVAALGPEHGAVIDNSKQPK